MVVLAQLVRASVCGTEGRGFEPHIPPVSRKTVFKGCFSRFQGYHGHTTDTEIQGYSPMRPYSKPVIRKTNPKLWYVEFTYTVPVELREFYDRKTKRFKKYGDINRYDGSDREINAEELRSDWEYTLKNLGYNPFAEHLKMLGYINEQEIIIEEKEAEVQKAEELPMEDKRKLTPIGKAFDLFIDDLQQRTKNTNSVSSYRVTVKWLSEALGPERLKDPVSSIRHLEISNAVMETKKVRSWSNTSYNKAVNFAMIIFNWFETEEYIHKNTSSGRIRLMKTNKSKHRWYEREVADKVKDELLRLDCMPVYRACQFTYHLCIRSKAELMKLKVGDIDRKLKRIRFSAELSKDGVECYRDYTPEFDQVLTDMDFDSYPKNFYVFGKRGVPGEYKCHKDFLAVQFRPIRERLGLSEDYSIYGWKHTRTIHEMMKKADPYQIQHLLRHDNIKTTMDYMRDFDISLVNVYGPDDLTF
jgi:integrase